MRFFTLVSPLTQPLLVSGLLWVWETKGVREGRVSQETVGAGITEFLLRGAAPQLIRKWSPSLPLPESWPDKLGRYYRLDPLLSNRTLICTGKGDIPPLHCLGGSVTSGSPSIHARDLKPGTWSSGNASFCAVRSSEKRKHILHRPSPSNMLQVLPSIQSVKSDLRAYGCAHELSKGLSCIGGL